MHGSKLESFDAGSVANVRVSVLYNEGAGDGVALNRICRALTRHDHHLVQVVERSRLTRLRPSLTDLVVAAGGDGTVAAAARYLAGRHAPPVLAVLPFGTANNIAKSLGVHGSLDDIVDGWRTAPRRAIDLGSVRHGAGSWGFLESVGVGLLAAAIAESGTRHECEWTRHKMAPHEGARFVLDVLQHLASHRSTVICDGIAVSGEFLFVEVLNMPLVGPNLCFSAETDPSDRQLTVVTATEAQRDALRDYLAARGTGRDAELDLPARAARTVEIHGGTGCHLDDQVRTLTAGSPLRIAHESARIEVLADPAFHTSGVMRQLRAAV